MAAGQLPFPGTEDGPCKSRCNHIDCKQTRAMAKTPCQICKNLIGYDCPFYDHPMRHAICAENEV
jgi:hypothetical protein